MKWTVEIEVADSLVADGLALTERRMHEAMTRAFPYTLFTEFNIKILTKPADADVARLMGYTDVESYLAERK